MHCKNCGGELLFCDGEWVCQSCGAKAEIKGAYENIDVYICYEKVDALGRRTRDCIVAQEVYNKLEAAKVSVFYERISADSVAGEDLIAVRQVAMHRAKVVLVLGTSVENFQGIANEYGEILSQKTVIPFCVDVDPGKIPALFSKKQAISYTTIGWDKDLRKGVYRLLGREKELDTIPLYGNRRKKGIVFFAIAAAVLLLAALVILLICQGDKKPAADNRTTVGETTQATVKTLTQQEIYDQAMELYDQEAFIEALNLLLQIPEHANSANMIHLIYAKYEGYYQNGNSNIHLGIFDNVRADVEFVEQNGEQITRIAGSAEILLNEVSCDYVDNHQNSGNFRLVLEDAGLRLYRSSDADTEEVFFVLTEKSDQPIFQVEADVLLGWLKKRISFSAFNALGYELEEVDVGCPSSAVIVCRIKNTEIYLSFSDAYSSGEDEYHFVEDRVLVGITAPAEVIAPKQIGKELATGYEGDLCFRPNCVVENPADWLACAEIDSQWPESSNGKIAENTLLCAIYRKNHAVSEWAMLSGEWD